MRGAKSMEHEIFRHPEVHLMMNLTFFWLRDPIHSNCRFCALKIYKNRFCYILARPGPPNLDIQ